jgi:predicted GNAT family acetyltransferase
MNRVARNDGAGRYELFTDGELASYASFRQDGSRIVFYRTETGERFRGQGLAGELVEAALKDARERGLEVVAECPFVRRFIEEHPEPGERARSTEEKAGRRSNGTTSRPR